MMGGMNAAWRSMQPKKRKCERCGLYYRASLPKCRYCGNLDEAGLQRLLAWQNQERSKLAPLGKTFFILALGIFILMLLAR